jgi:hypothetical protein
MMLPTSEGLFSLDSPSFGPVRVSGSPADGALHRSCLGAAGALAHDKNFSSAIARPDAVSRVMPQLRAIGLSQLVAPHAGPGVTSNVHIKICTVQLNVPSSVITTILENDALFLCGYTMSSLSPLSWEDHVLVIIGLLSTIWRDHLYLLFHLSPSFHFLSPCRKTRVFC